MLIDVDQQWWEPDVSALLDPGDYLPRRSRVIFHEAMHYWHQLSDGFLVRLAQEDWDRLIAYEQQSELRKAGPYRHEYVRRTGRYGFSAYDLSECLARYWEVVIVDPVTILQVELAEGRRSKEFLDELRLDMEEGSLQAEGEHATLYALDLAMRTSGNYAVPYNLLRHSLDDFVGVAIFPLLVHFAMQTLSPVFFFERFVEEVAPIALDQARDTGLAEGISTGSLDALYPYVERKCSQLVIKERESGLLHGFEVFNDGSLSQNYAYWWSFARLQVAMDSFIKDMRKEGGMKMEKSKADAFNEVYSDFGGWVAYFLLDCAIALPGNRANRLLLSTLLTPPCVRFSDGRILGLWDHYMRLGAQYTRDAEPPEGLKDRTEKVTRETTALQSRWEAFLTVLRGY
jgi:hypothetical protein